MYYLRIDGTDYPVPPESWDDSSGNKNEMVTLANGEDINIIRPEGLHEYTMEIRLPYEPHPWAYGSFNPPTYYLNLLKALKTDERSFDLIIVRDVGDNFTDTVTLEDYVATEDTEFTRVNVRFKQYVDYETQVKKKAKKKAKKK